MSQLESAIKTLAQWENHDRFRVTEGEKSLWSNGVEPDDVALAREVIRLTARLDQLTAANERVAELEREVESMQGLLGASRVASDRAMRDKCSMEAENSALKARVAELAELVVEAYEHTPTQLQQRLREVLGNEQSQS